MVQAPLGKVSPPPPLVGRRGVDDAIKPDRSLLFQRKTGQPTYNLSV
jgi:hypothetical protein